MRTVRLCTLALGLLSMITAACNPFLGIIPPQGFLDKAATPQPTPRAWDFPRGRFSAVSAPNTLMLAIENDGRFRIFLDNGPLDFGRFDVAGPQALVDSLTCAQRGDKPALYNWLYNEEVGLAFQAAATDPCPERRQYLSEEYQPKYMFVFNIPDRGVSREWLK